MRLSPISKEHVHEWRKTKFLPKYLLEIARNYMILHVVTLIKNSTYETGTHAANVFNYNF